ncbi:MAG: beta-lactamase family protein [Niastella sp.]|nr:beta-lactamase family protein [Niastella sp.]
MKKSKRGRYLIIAVVLSSIILMGCNAVSKPGNIAAHSDSTGLLYELPKPGNLNKVEMQRLHDACSHWFDSALGNTVFNGGLLVAQKGNIIFEKYKGTMHLDQQDTITDATPFHLASVSKTFTAMAVLDLWQQKKISLDDEFSKYFSAFNYPGVTIRNLLDHRSGLPNYVYFLENTGWNIQQKATNRDVLNELISKKNILKDIRTPDTHFSYCNTNYALLALLIEKITGLPYPQYIQQHFFEPLNMTHTYVLTLADSGKVPPSYDWRGREMNLNFLDFVYGDKDIYSTPRDLLKWDRFLSSGLLFTAETLNQAYTGYSNEKPGIRNYGLGWRLNIYDNHKKMIYHNGWWHGNNSVFIRLLDEDVTIIAVNNRFTRATYHANQLANIFASYFAPADEETEQAIADSSKSESQDSTKKKNHTPEKKH